MVMIVFLAEITYAYENGYTVGIYSTKELAEKALQTFRKNNLYTYGEDSISDWMIDDGIVSVDV